MRITIQTTWREAQALRLAWIRIKFFGAALLMVTALSMNL